MTTEALKLVSLNVRSISNFRKRRAIFTWCQKRMDDFMYLLETHSEKDTEIYWKNEWVGRERERCRLCYSHQDP